MSIQEKIEKARELHKQGLNCSQCTALMFKELTNLDEETIKGLTVGFGGGVGGQGEICGAVTGIVMIEGLRRKDIDETKMMKYQKIKDISAEFIKENGSLVCSELRSKDGLAANGNAVVRKPCMQYIEDMIIIYDKYLKDAQK